MALAPLARQSTLLHEAIAHPARQSSRLGSAQAEPRTGARRLGLALTTLARCSSFRCFMTNKVP
jgi:hypothetical protein